MVGWYFFRYANSNQLIIALSPSYDERVRGDDDCVADFRNHSGSAIRRQNERLLCRFIKINDSWIWYCRKLYQFSKIIRTVNFVFYLPDVKRETSFVILEDKCVKVLKSFSRLIPKSFNSCWENHKSDFILEDKRENCFSILDDKHETRFAFLDDKCECELQNWKINAINFYFWMIDAKMLLFLDDKCEVYYTGSIGRLFETWFSMLSFWY